MSKHARGNIVLLMAKKSKTITLQNISIMYLATYINTFFFVYLLIKILKKCLKPQVFVKKNQNVKFALLCICVYRMSGMFNVLYIHNINNILNCIFINVLCSFFFFIEQKCLQRINIFFSLIYILHNNHLRFIE